MSSPCFPFGPTQPNFNSFIEQSWAPGGGGTASPFPWQVFNGATNVVVGSNPPYSATDFLNFYPNFGGSPQNLSGTITEGSQVVTGITSTAGVLPGQAVSPTIPLGDGNYLAGVFPNGTLVLSVDSATQITLTNPATADGSVVSIYTKPFVPFVVLNAYIFLASSSLAYGRWFDQWAFAMGLYVAHYCTLYLRATSASTPTSAASLAQQGIARGILVSKAAGGVSAGIQPVTGGGSGLEDWGHWQETEFGVQFATIARVIGAGPMLCW